MPERLVVIGGDAGGMSAASQARRRKPPSELEIVAFERGNFTSYSACGIPYFVGRDVKDLDELVVRTPQEFMERQTIDARLHHEVTEIDLDRRAVRVRDLERKSDAWESFDHLLVATGAKPLRPPLEGVDSDGIFGVQVLDDGREIDAAIERRSPKTAVVVGSGYIGLEMAEAFVRRGIDTSIVDQLPQPMGTLDPDMGALIADSIHNVGVKSFFGEAVKSFDSDDGHVTAVVTEARTLPADIVVLGLGARPNTELAKAAGIEIGTTGGIVVDRRQRTRSEGVWAAGDCTEKFHRVSQRPVAIALGTHANKEGRVAGINIGGGYATFPGVIGTAVSKLCDYEVARTGLKFHEAEEAGFEPLVVTVDSTTRAGYYPETKPIKVKLIVELMSGRLLGAQIVGQEGAAKRIDVLAAALWSEMRVDEILNLDLGYAPPFSPVWDPVLIAARQAWQLVELTAPRSL